MRGVRTSEGRLAAGAVVLAAGTWTAPLAASAGLPLPLEPRKGQLVRLRAPGPGFVRHKVLDGAYLGTVASPDAGLQLAPVVETTWEGDVLVGSSRERRGFDTAVDAAVSRALVERAAALFPSLRTLPVADAWAGLRPWLPDRLPAVGPSAAVPGLWLATGHEGAGVALGPGHRAARRAALLRRAARRGSGAVRAGPLRRVRASRTDPPRAPARTSGQIGANAPQGRRAVRRSAPHEEKPHDPPSQLPPRPVRPRPGFQMPLVQESGRPAPARCPPGGSPAPCPCRAPGDLTRAARAQPYDGAPGAGRPPAPGTRAGQRPRGPPPSGRLDAAAAKPCGSRTSGSPGMSTSGSTISW